MQVTTERIITVNEAHGLLKDRQKQGNLSYEQQNTLNYLEDLVKLDDKDSDKMVKELKGIGFTEWQAVKATDLLPKKEEELKIVLAGSGAIEDGVLKKAFEIVKNYKKDAKEPAKTKKVEPAPKEAEKPQISEDESEKQKTADAAEDATEEKTE